MTLPSHDDLIDDEILTVFGVVSGQFIVCYDQRERYDDKRGETYIMEVRGAEIVGFRLDGNVYLTRDQLVNMIGQHRIDYLEEVFAERQRESM